MHPPCAVECNYIVYYLSHPCQLLISSRQFFGHLETIGTGFRAKWGETSDICALLYHTISVSISDYITNHIVIVSYLSYYLDISKFFAYDHPSRIIQLTPLACSAYPKGSGSLASQSQTYYRIQSVLAKSRTTLYI